MVKYLFRYMKQAEEIQEEMDLILENLEESILITKDFKAEFVNKRFLESFSQQISEFVPEDSGILEEEIL